MDAVFGRIKKVIVSTIDLVKDTGELIQVETQEAARVGFGLPRAVTSISSLGCFVVLAAGTTSIALDAFNKVYGPKECDGCAGWESVCCQMCKGTGRVQYGNLPDSISVPSNSNEILTTEIFLPLSCNTSDSLPIKNCPNCSGSGVMKCKVCNGNATKKCLSLANVLDAPWKSYQVYRKSKPASLPSSSMEADVSFGPYWLFDRRELLDGKKIPEEEKEKIWWNYMYSQQYNMARQKLIEREKGWEELQNNMINFDPITAISDPAIIHNYEKFYLEEKAKNEVWSKPVPPRPSDWMVGDKNTAVESLKLKSDFEKQIFEKKKKNLEQQLDLEWKETWRQNQIESRVKELEQLKVHEKERAILNAEVSKGREGEEQILTQSGISVEETKNTETETKKERKKVAPSSSSAAEEKKKEREEKKQKYARQAAEREAYLAKRKQNSS